METWDLYKCDGCGRMRMPRVSRTIRDLCPFCSRPLYFIRRIDRVELADLIARVPVDQLRAVTAAEEAVAELRQRLIEQDQTGAQRLVARLRESSGKLEEMIGGQKALPW